MELQRAAGHELCMQLLCIACAGVFVVCQMSFKNTGDWMCPEIVNHARFTSMQPAEAGLSAKCESISPHAFMF